jgi:hypothetical protein
MEAMHAMATEMHTMTTNARVNHIPTHGISTTGVLRASFFTGNLDEAAELVLDRVACHGDPDRV